MGKSAIPYFQLLLVFFCFFFQTAGSKMQVALSFLLIIASVVQVGNARFGKENIVKEKNDVIEKSYAIRQKEAPSGLFKSVLTKANRRARNEETNKIHVMEKNMAMNMAMNMAKNMAMNDEEY